MGFSSKHLTVFSPETVNIKKLANLTANTKNYRQITLNTKPHSDPPNTLFGVKCQRIGLTSPSNYGL